MRPRLVVVATLFLVGGIARGYVRSRTDKGVPIAWPGSCVWVQPDSAGSIDLPIDTVLQVIDKSISNWQTVTLGAGCSYLKINRDAPAALEAHLDHINIIKFRSDKWCRPGEPNTPEMCYSPSAAAITTVFYTADGQIVDADVELNQCNFTFVWLPSNVQPRSTGCGMAVQTMDSDLENTLTHELGHLQGLDHTCWDHVLPTAPLDDMGNPIPDCNDVLNHNVPPDEYQRIVQSTMFNFATPGETIKRMPKTDDINGICGIYPSAKDPKSCMRPSPVQGGGCAVGARSGGLAFALMTLMVILLVRRNRYY